MTRLDNTPVDLGATWQFQIATSTGSDQQVRPAVIDKRHYVTDLILGNTSATATIAIVKDGSSGKLQIPLAPGATVAIRLSTPLRCSVNSPLNIGTATAVSNVYINALGYTL